MGKKSRKIKDTSEIITYTKEEKNNKIKELVTKLEMFGLSIYVDEMKKLDEISNKYIYENIEYREIIPLPNSKRKMKILFLNNKKHDISINLIYDKKI